MNEEWGTPVSKGKIIDRRNRLIEYRNTREIRTIPLSRVIDENILDINYMIYEIERLNNIIKEVREYIETLNEYGIGKNAKKELLEILGEGE